MINGVTKQEFVKALEGVVVLTRDGVSNLELVDEDTVAIHFYGGGKKLVNIALDSGSAIIRDVAKHID